VLKDKKTVVQREKDRLSQEMNLIRKQVGHSVLQCKCNTFLVDIMFILK